MTLGNRIGDALRLAFDPSHMEVIDESAQHAGHAHARPGGETHFRVRVVAQAFRGKSRLERHRLVNGALAEEFARGLHALAIEARAPDER
jgi:BolA protein